MDKKNNSEKKEASQSLEELMKLPKNGFINEDTYIKEAMDMIEHGRSGISTSKLRSMYGQLCEISKKYDPSAQEELSKDCISALRLLRIQIIYSMGRDENVMNFIKDSHLVAYICHTEEEKNSSCYKLLCKYFEALVAFHRFKYQKES